MKRFISVMCSAILVLALGNGPTANAGRIGGPTTVASMVPAGSSIYYDIPFSGGAPATVSVTGDGRSMVFVIITDANGHSAVSDPQANSHGTATVSMNVNRAGNFRVEVRNIGIRSCNFTMTTN